LYPYGQITIQQLLSHTSGIPEQPGGWQARIDQENGDVIEFLKKQERLDFKPGTRYAYSNNGFILVANMGDPSALMQIRSSVDALLKKKSLPE